jgi:hypothetical protein
MNARPILFSGPMVRALLDGRKTQTRRVVKPQPFKFVDHSDEIGGWYQWWDEGREPCGAPTREVVKPIPYSYGKPGDLLWVRESLYRLGRWQQHEDETGERDSRWHAAEGVCYHADHSELPERDGFAWRRFPSIHMPRSASRLTLELTEVRIERLLEISEADKIAEGGIPDKPFGTIWQAINTKPGIRWEDNPWVWALSFRVHQQNVDALLRARGQS